jgi:hypothetical protein
MPEMQPHMEAKGHQTAHALPESQLSNTALEKIASPTNPNPRLT